MENKVSRFKAREQGFILIFEMNFNTEHFTDVIKAAEETRDIVFEDYAKELALGVYNTKDDLDAIISAHLKKGWNLKRISKASLSILRLALYEMTYVDSVPSSVAINEAVELAKKYTIDESKFINGVLGAISREEK